MGKVRAALILSSLFAAHAQPRFEVVSIKSCKEDPNKANPGREAYPSSPGRIRFDCLSLAMLIRNAYLMYPDGKPWPRSPRTGLAFGPVSYFQRMQPIEGKAKWITGDRFTIDARAERPVATEMMRGPMLRAILEDRFKLKIHWETREVPVYELTVAKGGAKLQPAKDGACTPQTPGMMPPAERARGKGPTLLCGGFHVPVSGNGTGLYTECATMADLCYRFSMGLERDVIDKTGIQGMYDVHLELTFADIFPRPPAAAPPSDPGAASMASDPVGSITSALRKLGLVLRPAKGPGRFLVIDQVLRPTEN